MLRTPRLRIPLGRAFQAQAPHRRFTKGAQSIPASIGAAGYAATASAIAVIAAWWSIGTPDLPPLLESRPGQHLVVESDPSKAEVTRILSQEAYSFNVRHTAGIERYDGARLASNSPCEDRFTHGLVSPWHNGSPWVALALFDGHAGWQTADFLEKKLIPSVRHGLSQIKPPSGGEITPERTLHGAIMKAFVDLDNSIIKTAEDAAESDQPLQEKVRRFAPAFAGSCALLSLYDPMTSRLHVACTGDSRAVLGRQSPDGKWEAIPLSTDQTGSNVAEVARLNTEHPSEEGLAQDGRVLGLAVSRAFGDGRWKWPSEATKGFSRRFCGPGALPPKYNIQTPPYITAEPVVTTTTIKSGGPSFLILATDGLWNRLSNQQAVDLVAAWLDSGSPREDMESSKSEPTSYAPFDFGDFRKGVSPDFVDERTTIQDDNAAVHLMRNSLGGNHSELIAGRLALTPPYSRNRRDDITIQVVFFNNTIAQANK
ncbi:protein phosphatase 2C domain-containing protein [Hirsutella rhossiliensis]|uniref:Protein phosphatase 2C domain-containing protein n=1 Tax=Hirsutella rhossiliensis TaxID=111463 RepID=A0A9P8MY42_9HYPO|nr:protein phosphatase 2C domain-containing protein [Hirsutella rhossiliensis]KAH0964198.1 protein phosphatase 2C domain-containing protein [Hirsutella rhossiliensis]